jgi:FMN-dependent NADH-azoreductase
MKRFFFIAMVLLLLSACGNKSKTVMPSRLLTEQEMIAIMTDVQILEADMNYRKNNGKMIGDMPKEYYRQLFEHYGITDSIFAENMRYYTHNPATIERIMDSVTQRIISSAPKPEDH